MKLSDILLLTLFLVMGSMIFAMKKMQSDDGGFDEAIPVPALKPEPKPLSKIPKLRLQKSTPGKPGSYGRLSLDEFLAKGSPSIGIRDVAPKETVKQEPPNDTVIKRPRASNAVPVLSQTPSVKLTNLELDKVEAIKLDLPKMDENGFVDRVVNMAEASPIQPDSRDCGTLQPSFKAEPKHAKIRSVGMERQLTDRTTIGVEYVYKDGCYKNAIAPLSSLDMPGDDGVNLRVNMKF